MLFCSMVLSPRSTLNGGHEWWRRMSVVSPRTSDVHVIFLWFLFIVYRYTGCWYIDLGRRASVVGRWPDIFVGWQLYRQSMPAIFGAVLFWYIFLVMYMVNLIYQDLDEWIDLWWRSIFHFRRQASSMSIFCCTLSSFSSLLFCTSIFIYLLSFGEVVGQIIFLSSSASYRYIRRRSVLFIFITSLHSDCTSDVHLFGDVHLFLVIFLVMLCYFDLL